MIGRRGKDRKKNRAWKRFPLVKTALRSPLSNWSANSSSSLFPCGQGHSKRKMYPRKILQRRFSPPPFSDRFLRLSPPREREREIPASHGPDVDGGERDSQSSLLATTPLQPLTQLRGRQYTTALQDRNFRFPTSPAQKRRNRRRRRWRQKKLKVDGARREEMPSPFVERD